MAYDPTIPALNNYIGDDIPKIMANFAELAGSRIVDHNLDVPNPPNGWYVRWENGLQICWGDPKNTFPGGSSTNLQTHTFPATFVSTPVVTYSTKDYSLYHESHGVENPTATSFVSYIKQVDTNARTYTVFYVAIGMWK